ncbi:hypothetical protein EWM64_g3416 [Hericium alpestre]|uniref:Uncharacterized protein n=1 Tax=Hericium alpestre TaxID=135208 RepID=A0A4Z0A2R1_9AGAM|nr:hypothetical protein EWM64_g3416 [Hericium alpestre]
MSEAGRLAKYQDDAEWANILGKLDCFYKKYNELVPRYDKMSRFKRAVKYYQIRKEVHLIKEDLGEALEDIEAQLMDHAITAIVEAAGLEGVTSVTVNGQGDQFLKVPERSDVKNQLHGEASIAGGFQLWGGKGSPCVSVSRITVDQHIGMYQPRPDMAERN